MPIFHEAGPEARQRLVKRSKGYQDRAVYRDILSRLPDDTIMEVDPEGGETLRKIKVNIRRAANELSLEGIRYGETVDGVLLVWSDTTKRRQGRRRKVLGEEAI